MFSCHACLQSEPRLVMAEQALAAWAAPARCGAEAHADAWGGRGLYASAALPPRTVALRVPRARALCAAAAATLAVPAAAALGLPLDPAAAPEAVQGSFSIH